MNYLQQLKREIEDLKEEVTRLYDENDAWQRFMYCYHREIDELFDRLANDDRLSYELFDIIFKYIKQFDNNIKKFIDDNKMSY